MIDIERSDLEKWYQELSKDIKFLKLLQIENVGCHIIV